jgi:energy-coupling factor transport system permease protein
MASNSRLELVYRDGDSFFHRSSPLSKILYVVAASMFMAIYFDFYVQLGLVVVVSFIALTLTGTPFRRYWGFLKWVFVFMIALGISGALFVNRPGPVVLRTPLRDFSFRELTDGFTMGLQFFVLGWVSMSFVFTTHPRDFAQAMSRLGLKYRFAHGFILALVFLPIILAEANNVSNAHKIRDFGAGKSRFMRWVYRLQHLSFALVVRVLRRAETIAVAMDAKGFGLSDERTYFTQYPRSLSGTVFGWASVAALVLFIVVSPPGADNRWTWWFNSLLDLVR